MQITFKICLAVILIAPLVSCAAPKKYTECLSFTNTKLQHSTSNITEFKADLVNSCDQEFDFSSAKVFFVNNLEKDVAAEQLPIAKIGKKAKLPVKVSINGNMLNTTPTIRLKDVK